MIVYKDDHRPSAEEAAELFKSSGIRRPYEDTERIGKMIANADLLITAWADGRLAGLARAITDFSYCCYLSDLAVDKVYQNQGIGRELVKRVQAAIGEECTLVLLSAPEAVDFYPRLGFTLSDKAYVIPRKK